MTTCEPNHETDGPHGTIVVVDDNFVNATLISRLIAKHGYAVETIDSGREAVRRAAAGAVDGMLLDLHMPDMDGFDTARAIRAGEASSTFRMPIIAVTADLHPDLLAQALAAGMDDLLLKPVSVAAVATVLERHLPPLPRRAQARESSGCLPICLPTFEPAALHQAEAASPGSGLRILGAFIAGLVSIEEALPGLVARNAFLEAQRLVHAQRAQTDAVGSLQLAQVLSDMEDGLRAGDKMRCQRVLRALHAAHGQFRSAVQAEGLTWVPPALNAASSAPGSALRPG